eukprot:scpid73372/ scgid27959/ 
MPNVFLGSGGGDYDEALPTLGNQLSTRLLFIHQEQWQKRLLSKYGQLVLIDATYRTTKYNVALIFLVVPTATKYMVVAEFVIQSECGGDIAEALEIIRGKNPNWSPEFFMTDYSEAEMLAIRRVSPGVRVMLCDLHREQCWLRWVKDSKHGLSQDEASSLLDMLRDLAYEPPAQKGPVDSGYRQLEFKLQESQVWQDHKAIQSWLQTKWLAIPEVWAIFQVY